MVRIIQCFDLSFAKKMDLPRTTRSLIFEDIALIKLSSIRLMFMCIECIMRVSMTLKIRKLLSFLF